MTREFELYRRIMLTIPYDQEIFTQVRTMPSTGEFFIRIAPVDTNLYTSRKSIRQPGKLPIRLIISFQDSVTILISGKTVPFESLISYNVIESDQYIFDIYKSLPIESYYREKTITLNTLNNKPFNDGNTFGTNTEYFPDRFDTQTIVDRDRNVRARLVRSLALSAGVVFLIIAASCIAIFSFMAMRKGNFQFKIKGRSSSTEIIPQKGNVVLHGVSKDGLDATIRQLMTTKNISYDEAAMLVNMSKGQLNVKA